MRIASAQLWVDDQDAALEFWTSKVGMEVRDDVTVPEMGNFRWLTVGPPGQEDVTLVLMKIMGPPVFDEATVTQLREVVAKGGSATVFLTTPDCRATFEELRARGVEFVSEPEEMPYGVDCGFRDPDGNNVRLTQLGTGWTG